MIQAPPSSTRRPGAAAALGLALVGACAVAALVSLDGRHSDRFMVTKFTAMFAKARGALQRWRPLPGSRRLRRAHSQRRGPAGFASCACLRAQWRCREYCFVCPSRLPCVHRGAAFPRAQKETPVRTPLANASVASDLIELPDGCKIKGGFLVSLLNNVVDTAITGTKYPTPADPAMERKMIVESLGAPRALAVRPRNTHTFRALTHTHARTHACTLADPETSL